MPLQWGSFLQGWKPGEEWEEAWKAPQGLLKEPLSAEAGTETHVSGLLLLWKPRLGQVI